MFLRYEQLKAAWLAGLATVFFCVEWSLARGPLARAGGPLPWAVAFDLLCTFPCAYVWLVLRPAARPLSELVPVLVSSLLAAHVVLARSSQLQAPLWLWSAALELALVSAFILRGVRLVRGRAGQDALLTAQQAREPLLRLLGLELCMLYFALFARARCAPPGCYAFENGRSARQLLAALALVSVLEAIGLHVVLLAFWPKLAWLTLALSLYGLLWLTAAHRAFRLRPLLVMPDRVLVRVSMLFSASFPRAAILRAERYLARVQEPGVTRLTLASPPNVLITLREPICIYGAFGRTTQSSRIALQVEDTAALLALLQRA